VFFLSLEVPMFSQVDAIALLNAYQPTDTSEQEAKAFIQSFVNENAEYWSRRTLSGHLTGSAWITNTERTQAVLLHHKKLDIWVQPGGHMDDSDDSLVSASLREAVEETGLNSLALASESIFDLDVHEIPARKEEPKHWHLDVRYWFEAKDMTLSISEESNDLKWLTRSEIENITSEESVLRMVRKTLTYE
jgi:ADP-ribose pyrophosphatase YjhB (NUDIX family)